jgi:hypothetical protein
VRAETCSDVACVIYTRKEVVAKEAIVTVFICDARMYILSVHVWDDQDRNANSLPFLSSWCAVLCSSLLKSFLNLGLQYYSSRRLIVSWTALE